MNENSASDIANRAGEYQTRLVEGTSFPYAFSNARTRDYP